MFRERTDGGDGVERVGGFLRGDAYPFRNLGEPEIQSACRRPLAFRREQSRQPLLFARDLDRTVVAQKPPDLPEDQGDGVGREGAAPREVEGADGFEQTDLPDVKEFLPVVSPVGKPRRHAPDKTGVGSDEFLLRPPVAVPRRRQQPRIVVVLPVGVHRLTSSFYKM